MSEHSSPNSSIASSGQQQQQRYLLRDSYRTSARYRENVGRQQQDDQQSQAYFEEVSTTPKQEIVVHQSPTAKRAKLRQPNTIPLAVESPIRSPRHRVPQVSSQFGGHRIPIQVIISNEGTGPTARQRQIIPASAVYDGAIDAAEQEVSTSDYNEMVALSAEAGNVVAHTSALTSSSQLERCNRRHFSSTNTTKPTTSTPRDFSRRSRLLHQNLAVELSAELKLGLKKLKNVLKLPKARRFVFCEFFYSGVDQQIFLAENEFSQLMRESFPNLKCTRLRKPEWREVRRLIGRPRRCSQSFLEEEREALAEKRKKIRSIYEGSCLALSEEEQVELPSHLPLPPVLGQKIYARVRRPKDGVYVGAIDAISAGDGAYRVVFEDLNIPPSVIKDYEMMFDQPVEIISLQYFLEQNRANRARSSSSYINNQQQKTTEIPSYGQHRIFYGTLMGRQENNQKNQQKTAAAATICQTTPSLQQQFDKTSQQQKLFLLSSPGKFQQKSVVDAKAKIASIGKDEKVGNFPVRMLVILVKLCKVVEFKKQLVGKITAMNDCAERMQLLGEKYPLEFKAKFAQFVLDLGTVSRLFLNYLSALQVHYTSLVPHLAEPLPMDRPDTFRRTCNTHAFQIVKHCNSELNVNNKRILQLITSLTSILLQMRTIGVHKKCLGVTDAQILGDSLKQIRSQIAPTNAAAFQDHIEVHLKQILRLTRH